MSQLPEERRAIGLALRHAERWETIQSPPELQAIVGALPYPALEIDRGLALLVDARGRTVGGTLNLGDLDEMWLHDLWASEMIERRHGAWVFTDKGHCFSELLTEYAAPHHRWRSLVNGGAPKS